MSDDMRLPNVSETAITALAKNWEWYMDPPPFLTRILPDDILVNIHRVKIQHFAELAKIESRIKLNEAKMLNEMAEILGKFG